MTREVFCKKYQKNLEGLQAPPFPGPAGKEIFETISKKAWQEWLKHQTLLINEKHLQLMAPTTQAYLTEQRGLFFDNKNFDHADGYTPAENSK